MADLFNPDYLLHLCKKYGLNPSKKYGQNYLIDENVIAQIISDTAITKNDNIVEVGPGFGILTLPLAEQAGKVTSFEIEKKLEPYWTNIIKDRNIPNLEIVWGNILKQFPILEFQFSYKVVANLPYQITSAVIRLFLEAENPPAEMILMVQKEVGERITAKPGDMSLLAISVQYYAETEYLFTVPRSAFWPSPQVDSCVIRIKNKAVRPSKELDVPLFAHVKAGFAAKRKLLFKNLLATIGKDNRALLEAAFQELGLTLSVRAQELSVEQWVKLTEMLRKKV
jgi:16S rRNA (adenine1518-N6/adenine1519-N6)-dimethyltransferase